MRINEKMTSSMNLSYQGELLVKDSSWYHFQIPRYCMAVNFFYNSWSVNSDHPKTRDHFAHAQKSYEGYFNLKMFATKFCSRGHSFISIAQVAIELLKISSYCELWEFLNTLRHRYAKQISTHFTNLSAVFVHIPTSFCSKCFSF